MAGTARETRWENFGDGRIAEDGARTAKAPAANLRTGSLLNAEEASMFCCRGRRTKKWLSGEGQQTNGRGVSLPAAEGLSRGQLLAESNSNWALDLTDRSEVSWKKRSVEE